MGFCIVILGKSGKQSRFDLSQADVQLLKLLAELVPAVSSHISVLLSDEAPPAGWQTIQAGALLEHVREVIARLRQDELELPYTYDFSVTMPGVGVMRSGGIGFQLNQERFALWGGLGKCVLEKYSVPGPDGKRLVTESRDARELKEIETSDVGKITIHKRRKRTQLLETLEQIEGLLSNVPSEEIMTVGAG